MLSFPPFRLDIRDERIWKNDGELHLRRKPFAILKHLATNPQRLVTHTELVEAVWGRMALSESVLRTHVRDLRRVLGEDIIETVVGRGYRFVPRVARDDRASDVRGNAAKPGPPSPMVARDAELEELREAFRYTRDLALSHALLAHVALALVPAASAPLLHRRTAEWLATAYGERADEIASEITLH